MRWHADEASKHQEKALIHLKRLEELSQGRSPIVEDFLPTIVLTINTIQKTLEQFRARL